MDSHLGWVWEHCVRPEYKVQSALPESIGCRLAIYIDMNSIIVSLRTPYLSAVTRNNRDWNPPFLPCLIPAISILSRVNSHRTEHWLVLVDVRRTDPWSCSGTLAQCPMVLLIMLVCSIWNYYWHWPIRGHGWVGVLLSQMLYLQYSIYVFPDISVFYTSTL